MQNQKLSETEIYELYENSKIHELNVSLESNLKLIIQLLLNCNKPINAYEVGCLLESLLQLKNNQEAEI